MSIRGPWRTLLAAVWTALVLAPPALTLAQLARAGSVSCACASRACCCAPQRGGARSRACHGGGAQPDATAPRWRCRHAQPSVWLASDPALLNDPAPLAWTPPVPRAFADLARAAFGGFPRLDSPPPRPSSRV